MYRVTFTQAPDFDSPANPTVVSFFSSVIFSPPTAANGEDNLFGADTLPHILWRIITTPILLDFWSLYQNQKQRSLSSGPQITWITGPHRLGSIATGGMTSDHPSYLPQMWSSPRRRYCRNRFQIRTMFVMPRRMCYSCLGLISGLTSYRKLLLKFHILFIPLLSGGEFLDVCVTVIFS